MNKEYEYTVGATVTFSEPQYQYVLVIRDVDRADPEDVTYQCEVVRAIPLPVPALDYTEEPIKVGSRMAVLASDVEQYVEKTAADVLRNACDGMLTTDATERKASPVYSGFVKYFPLAMVEVARCSKAGNDQHHPGTPLHWDRSKSGDELDACMRHLMEAGTIDTDGVRHSAKAAWRAMANLEKELEAARKNKK